ncbi:hypothetical protein SBRCBS47491_007462 [Sporothrix bragantina]|uniref:Rhodopsin domain-containing protein n=1 Tax=Sporothrix bragantina TaxID=671064 RepID=A0ABP0CF79_9PEZI
MSTAPDPSTYTESTAWVVITVSTITMTVALTALAARVFTRAVLVKQFGADDWGACVAGLGLLLCGIWVCLNIKYGLGKHAWTLTGPEIENYFMYFYISIVWYNFTLVAVKLSFLLQYYRVFSIPKIRRIIIIMMIIIGGWSLSQLFVGIWICKPINKFWNSSLEGTCIPNIPQWYINAAGNIASDVSIFLFPIPILKNLNLKRNQKIIVMGIFSLGFFTCAISIVRIKYLKQFADFSWENVASSCWSVSELASAVTCLCLPTLKPLVQRVVPHLMGSTNAASTGPTGGHSSKGYRKHSENIDGSASGPSSSKGYRKHSENIDGSASGPSSSKASSARNNVRLSRSAGTMSTDSQDELYPVDIELAHSLERKGSGVDSVTSYATSPTSASPPIAQRELLGLRTTVRTKCAVTPGQPQMDAGEDIQVTHDVITKSRPRQ